MRVPRFWILGSSIITSRPINSTTKRCESSSRRRSSRLKKLMPNLLTLHPPSRIMKNQALVSTSLKTKSVQHGCWSTQIFGGKTDPFEYWRFKSGLFPSLAAMAKTYLSIPSTSTPSERAFSMGRLVIHHTRANLAAQTIRALMCLNSWNKNAFLNAL